MSNERRVVTAAEMDKMTPNERAEAVKAGVVRDLSVLDAAYLERLEQRGQHIASMLQLDG
jgi:hypothetical protein